MIIRRSRQRERRHAGLRGGARRHGTAERAHFCAISLGEGVVDHHQVVRIREPAVRVNEDVGQRDTTVALTNCSRYASLSLVVPRCPSRPKGTWKYWTSALAGGGLCVAGGIARAFTWRTAITCVPTAAPNPETRERRVIVMPVRATCFCGAVGSSD
jgi:hypothetical protein